jgi:hypothetical protein
MSANLEQRLITGLDMGMVMNQGMGTSSSLCDGSDGSNLNDIMTAAIIECMRRKRQ